MNAIDGLFNFMSSFLETVADWVEPVYIPWGRLTEKWAIFQPYITKWNTIFPLDSLMTIAGLMIAFVTVVLIIWTIKFIKSFIPFMG